MTVKNQYIFICGRGGIKTGGGGSKPVRSREGLSWSWRFHALRNIMDIVLNNNCNDNHFDNISNTVLGIFSALLSRRHQSITVFL